MLHAYHSDKESKEASRDALEEKDTNTEPRICVQLNRCVAPTAADNGNKSQERVAEPAPDEINPIPLRATFLVADSNLVKHKHN
ncbi:hypothetical protein, partial [Enterobacter cloacae]|uniref:hypothetical protein n=1 Tax=Enterobacter cloacae TaxID=550 RepID=UPI0021D20FBF